MLLKVAGLLVLGATVVQGQVESNPLNNNELTYNDMGSAPTLDQLWGEDWPFSGINTFAHLPYTRCLVDNEEQFDIGIIGVPFDTAVSYRPGARFGPRAIRSGSQRQTSNRGFNHRAGINPYNNWAKVIDCGDIPITPMDNNLAFKQMTKGFEELLSRKSFNSSNTDVVPPRFVALGGDHSVLLPHLRALRSIYGKINVIHFDAHLDTWSPTKYPSFWHSDQSELTHGSMLWLARQENLTSEHNIHAGLRTRISGSSWEDYEEDDRQNFTRIYADDIWVKGPQYVIDKILETVPENTPTYLSVDIDVLDPGFAAGTGTIESGGWLPRELLYVLRGIDSLNLVGADIVEVSPPFDQSEVTATNGAQVAFELITSMVKKGKIDHLVSGSEVKQDLISIKIEKKKTNVEEDLKLKAEIEKKITELVSVKDSLLNEIRGLRRLLNQS